MSAAAVLQAVSLIVDLTTAATALLNESKKIADAMASNGGALSDEQWLKLMGDAQLSRAALVAAISRRQLEENAEPK